MIRHRSAFAGYRTPVKITVIDPGGQVDEAEEEADGEADDDEEQ